MDEQDRMHLLVAVARALIIVVIILVPVSCTYQVTCEGGSGSSGEGTCSDAYYDETSCTCSHTCVIAGYWGSGSARNSC